MKIIGKFILLDIREFTDWLRLQNIKRKILLVQQHHTYIPAYKDFKGDNHFKLCQSMENAHLERGFAEIAQHITTFPDGKIMICRSIEKIPAGIKGANTNGICIENVGCFDIGKDTMSEEQKECIIQITKIILDTFNLEPSDKTVVYHHWYDLILGKRITLEGSGNTKSCPGTNFFGGNTVDDFNNFFLPLLQ